MAHSSKCSTYGTSPTSASRGSSPAYPDDEFEAYASAVLDHAFGAVADVDVPLERRIVKGHAAHELIEASRRADLVVVGSHGHGGVTGTLRISEPARRHAR